MSDEDPCAPESLQAALNQVSAFYQNTSDALLREDRKQKFDMDYDDGLGGNDFNQLFYDDFEVPADVTVSPDSVDTTMPPTPTTPAKLVATRQAKGRTNKPAPKQTTKRPPVKVNPTKPPVKRNPPQTKRNPPNQPHKQ